MIIVAHAERGLAGGLPGCPACGGQLRPWAHATARRVRQLDGTSLVVRPRRVRCAGCRATQVLLPASCLPRRADATAVIGAALLAKASGHGHRRIAADLNRPASTVRRWLRHVRSGHLQWLRSRGAQRAAELDPQVLNEITPAATPLGDALTALGAAVAAWRNRFARHADAWSLICLFTGGRLLHPG